MGIVYLLKLLNCLKFGRTDDFIRRFAQYKLSEPKILFCLDCIDNKESEREILKILRTKYKTREDLGTEHFDLSCDTNSMICDIHNYFYKPEIKKQILENLDKEEKIEKVEKVEKIKVDIEVVKEKEVKESKELEEIKELKKKKKVDKSQIEKENNNKLFICKRCGLDFKEKRILVPHLKRKIICMPLENDISPQVLLDELNEKEGIECKNCKRVYKNENSLRAHNCISKDEILNRRVEKIEKKIKKIIGDDLL